MSQNTERKHIIIPEFSYVEQIKITMSLINKAFMNSDFIKVILFTECQQLESLKTHGCFEEIMLDKFTNYTKSSDIAFEGSEVIGTNELPFYEYLSTEEMEKSSLPAKYNISLVKTNFTHTRIDREVILTYKQCKSEESASSLNTTTVKNSRIEELTKPISNVTPSTTAKSNSSRNLPLFSELTSTPSGSCSPTSSIDSSEEEFNEDKLLLKLNISILYISSKKTLLKLDLYKGDAAGQFLKSSYSPCFNLIKYIISTYIPTNKNQESIILNTHNSKIFEMISNFNNLKKLNPALEKVKKQDNKTFIIEIDNTIYSMIIRECIKPTHPSDDCAFTYETISKQNSDTNHLINYVIKPISKSHCLVFLGFAFSKQLSYDKVSNLKTQQRSHLKLLKEFMESKHSKEFNSKALLKK